MSRHFSRATIGDDFYAVRIIPCRGPLKYSLRMTFHPSATSSEQKFEDRLREALSVPKMIISLTGPSKSGKTVLVKKVVGENLKPLSGATIRSGDALWSKVLGWMEVPDQRTEKTETATSMEATTNAGGKIGVPLVVQVEAKAGGKLGGERTYGQEKTFHQWGLGAGHPGNRQQ